MLMVLNRPDRRNAIDHALAHQLADALDELDRRDDVGAAVLAGNGPSFCAGMDLRAFAEQGPPPALSRIVSRAAAKPLIAAVDGPAFAGGFELAMTCDVIVASSAASFALPEAKVGLVAAAGGLYRLPHHVPHGVAMLMALTGDPITADRAYELGLVTELTPRGEARSSAMAMAQRIAQNAPLAVKASKVLVKASYGLTEREYWKFQSPHAEQVVASADATEGAAAFIERRTPKWSGR